MIKKAALGRHCHAISQIQLHFQFILPSKQIISYRNAVIISPSCHIQLEYSKKQIRACKKVLLEFN